MKQILMLLDNPTIYATTILLGLALYMLFRMLRANSKRKSIEYKQLIGVLQIARHMVYKSGTSKAGKGIIPAKVWKDVQMGVALTGNIKVR